MAIELKMPQLSDTMSAGKILLWKKKEGEAVSRGDVLAEVETDKANLEIESFHQGVLLKILVPASGSAKVGEVIAVIGQAGDVAAASNGSGTKVEVVAQAPKSVAPAAPKPTPVASKPVQQAAAPKIIQEEHSDRVKASPLAKKIAEQRAIDLSQVKGSGPEGRIVRRDLENVSAGKISAEPANEFSARSKLQSPVIAGPREGTLSPFSKMRETIARRMQESVRESPHFYLTVSVDMDEPMKLREQLKEVPAYKGISINHLVIKAVACALKAEPRVNLAVRDGQVYDPGHINLGIITAVPDGLLIPVIKDADSLSLKDIVFEARAAVERAKAGRPSSQDLSGGTFSISNMGMFDVENFTAIINPGQGGVLAISSVKQEAVVKDGFVVPGNRMKATISVDHRVIDGIMAANFMKSFKQFLETPALLFID